MAQATLSRPLLFGTGETPNDARIDHVVERAVETFMAAYETPAQGETSARPRGHARL